MLRRRNLRFPDLRDSHFGEPLAWMCYPGLSLALPVREGADARAPVWRSLR
jgi:hypothetical protein